MHSVNSMVEVEFEMSNLVPKLLSFNPHSPWQANKIEMVCINDLLLSSKLPQNLVA